MNLKMHKSLTVSRTLLHPLITATFLKSVKQVKGLGVHDSVDGSIRRFERHYAVAGISPDPSAFLIGKSWAPSSKAPSGNDRKGSDMLSPAVWRNCQPVKDVQVGHYGERHPNHDRSTVIR